MSGLDDLASLVRDDGVVLGAAPAAPYRQAEAAIVERRARGLFGDLRFTLTNAGALVPSGAARARRAQRDRGGAAALAPEPRAARRARRPHAALRLERSLRPAARAPAPACADAAAGARRAGCAVFVDSNHHVDRDGGQCAPASRSRQEHDGDRARRGLVRGARARSSRTPSSSRRRRARAARLRLLHALHRRLPDGRAGRARRARRDALPLDGRRRAGRSPSRRARRSRTASTAATSARTCARGTPARRGAAPTLPPEGGAWVSLADWLELPGRGAAGAARAPLRARARSALPAAQRARRARQRRRPEHRELARPYADSADPLLRRRAPRRSSARTERSSERADAVALGARAARAAEEHVVRARRRGSRRPRCRAGAAAARSSASQLADRAVGRAPAARSAPRRR